MAKRLAAAEQTVPIYTETLELAALLKWAQVVPTGGQAKQLITSGRVRVNGRVERRRTHRVGIGDVVAVGSQQLRVTREG